MGVHVHATAAAAAADAAAAVLCCNIPMAGPLRVLCAHIVYDMTTRACVMKMCAHSPVVEFLVRPNSSLWCGGSRGEEGRTRWGKLVQAFYFNQQEIFTSMVHTVSMNTVEFIDSSLLAFKDTL